MSSRAPAPKAAPSAPRRAPQSAGRADGGDTKRILWCLIVAFLLHQPLMASGLFGWLRFMFRDRIQDIEPPPEQESIISVDLDDDLFGEGRAGGDNGADNPAAPTAGGEDNGGDAVMVLDGGVDDDDDDSDEDSDDDLNFDDDDDDAATDAGAPDTNQPDAAAPLSVDAGVPLADAGVPVVDGGSPDGGAEALDAGAPLADAGLPAPDAGPIALPTMDAGTGAVPTTTDAGVGDDPYAGLDTPDAGLDVDAGVPPAAKLGPPVADPTALGRGANIGKSRHPNVRLYLNAKSMRQHRLGKSFGPLLNSIPEWQELLGGTNIDPIRDFDHLFIEGPQLRDPRDIITHIYYNVDDKRMHDAIDLVVKRSGKDGKWVEDQPVPVAAIGRKAYRRVALMPELDKFVVLPASEEKQVAYMAKHTKPLKKMRRPAILLSLKHPAHALRGSFPLPKTISSLKLRLSFDGKDDFIVDIDALDKSPEDAIRSMESVQLALQDIRQVPLSGFLTSKKYFFGKPTFSVDGKTIRMRAPVSASQVERILGLVDLYLAGRGDKGGAKGAKKK